MKPARTVRSSSAIRALHVTHDDITHLSELYKSHRARASVPTSYGLVCGIVCRRMRPWDRDASTATPCVEHCGSDCSVWESFLLHWRYAAVVREGMHVRLRCTPSGSVLSSRPMLCLKLWRVYLVERGCPREDAAETIMSER
eukprot:4950406-Pyramimonas_sp.AAC.1